MSQIAIDSTHMHTHAHTRTHSRVQFDWYRPSLAYKDSPRLQPTRVHILLLSALCVKEYL